MEAPRLIKCKECKCADTTMDIRRGNADWATCRRHAPSAAVVASYSTKITSITKWMANTFKLNFPLAVTTHTYVVMWPGVKPSDEMNGCWEGIPKEETIESRGESKDS